MVPEAPLEQTDEGLVPAGAGWFVLNAQEARWRDRPGRGKSVAFTGSTDLDVRSTFPQLGANLFVLGPGEPMSMYHWEADQEDFLVLSGEALLLVEGNERPLRQWDFVHCPAGTRHTILGAGEGPCAIFAVGSREYVATNWGAYTVDEVAQRHGIGVEEETSDSEVAYARFEDPKPTSYGDGWLPGGA